MIKFLSSNPFEEEAVVEAGNWDEQIKDTAEVIQKHVLRLRLEGVVVEGLPQEEDPTGGPLDAQNYLATAMAKVPKSPTVVFITTKELVVQGEEGKFMCIPYTRIILHSLMSAEIPKVYCQIDFNGYEEDGTTIQSEEGMDDDEDSWLFVEIMLIPNQAAQAEELYHAICECAVLHPSADGFDKEDSEGENFDSTTDADADATGSEGSETEEEQEDASPNSKEPRIDH